jgi:hypothetical protein
VVGYQGLNTQQQLPSGKPSYASFAVTIPQCFDLNKEQQQKYILAIFWQEKLLL